MELFEKIMELSPAELTIQEQARVEDNLPELKWDIYFPQQNVNSTDLKDITETDYRPVADRREWNAPGRNIPLKMGKIRDIQMTPIESYFKFDEKYMTKLFEQNGMNEATVLRAIRGNLPDRVEGLVDADYRRIELEAFRGWANGEITVYNPQTNQSYTVDLDIDANRYVTAAPAWTNSNAYEKLLAELYEAQNYIGNISEIVMRRTTAIAVQKSSPTIGANSVRMTLGQVQEQLTQEMGNQVTITIEERTLDVFDGAGTSTVTEKIWPSGKVGFVPANGIVGSTYFAPQVRAQSLAQVAGDRIDIRGVAVYYLMENDGKELKVQAQVNALPVPAEQSTYVVDAGI